MYITNVIQGCGQIIVHPRNPFIWTIPLFLEVGLEQMTMFRFLPLTLIELFLAYMYFWSFMFNRECSSVFQCLFIHRHFHHVTTRDGISGQNIIYSSKKFIPLVLHFECWLDILQIYCTWNYYKLTSLTNGIRS